MREFLSRYADLLTGICSRYITGPDDVNDVMQESLLHIISHISSFTYRGQGSLRAWASRIVVNESLRFLRTASLHELPLPEGDIPDGADTDDDGDAPPVSDIPPDELRRMKGLLPPGYRMVFYLYVFEGKSHHEIAAMLGIRENTSSSQLHRAKGLLARMIRQYNANHPTP